MKKTNEELIPEILQLLRQGMRVKLLIRGNSMRPLLVHERDRVELSLLEHRGVKVSDVVLAKVKDRYVIHRIVAINDNLITLRGDGNIGVEQCHQSDILATVVAFYRQGRAKALKADSASIRLYSWLWMRLFPIRRYLLFSHNLLFHSRKQLDR